MILRIVALITLHEFLVNLIDLDGEAFRKFSIVVEIEK